MTKEEAIRLGYSCKNLLASEDFVSTFKTIKDSIFEKWENSAPAEKEVREDNYRLLLAMRALENLLHAYVFNGEVEEKHAAIRNEEEQRKKELNNEQ